MSVLKCLTVEDEAFPEGLLIVKKKKVYVLSILAEEKFVLMQGDILEDLDSLVSNDNGWKLRVHLPKGKLE